MSGWIESISTDVSKELLVVYGLIVIVILMIVVILVMDKVNSKKQAAPFYSRRLSKRLKELRKEEKRLQKEETRKEPEKEEKVSIDDLDLSKTMHLEKMAEENQETLEENRKIDQNISVEIEKANVQEISTQEVKEEVFELEKEIEPELEKTQAQIDVEEITRALEKKVQEDKEKDKYEKYEEEQEQNAIISYKELKEKFDELYDENEKIQYLDDDTFPINLEELYEYDRREKEERKTSTSSIEPSPEEKKSQEKIEFKSSPIISPVYGIQKKEPVKEEKKTSEEELEKTRDFLNTLKDLQKNLN